MKSRATQRRTPAQGHEQVSVKDYFFRELPDGSLELRKDMVTRAELWGTLEFYHNKAIVLNRWYKVLWRSLTGQPSVLNPFQLIHVARVVKQEKKLVGSSAEVEKSATEARKVIDAQGKVVPA